jgi:predicted DNA-binding transcriptional regulator YafY
MPKPQSINKTERILSVYHLLTHYQEVAMKELTDLLPGCKKTFSRDIALLKAAGVQIRLVRRQAYILASGEHVAPSFSENKAERRFMEKIIRLITSLDAMPEDNCDKWYADSFPTVSKRTMQRDFATLNAIGYRIKYEREAFNCHDAGFDVPPGSYYCDRPQDTWSLSTFRRCREYCCHISPLRGHDKL